MPTAIKDAVLLSEAEYLAGEMTAEVRHEYMDGQVYAMSGGSANHVRLCMNLSTALDLHLKGKPCQPYSSDMKVKVGSKYFYPDMLVECSGLSGDASFTETPIILFEVLSKSTRRMDETTKRVVYMQIPSLLEYVLVEQDIVRIEVCRRSEGWQPMRYFLGDELTFESVGLTMQVEDIYDRVKNADMEEWLRRLE